MRRYSKAIGAAVFGGISVAVALGYTSPDEGKVLEQNAATIITAVMAIIGVWIAPRND